MTTIRFIIISLFCVLYALIITTLTSCDNADIDVKCDNVVCDTIDTYLFRQISSDKTIEYDLTYTDTVKLTKLDGEVTFEIHQCRHCEGIEYVDLISHDNKTIEKVKVHYSGGGQSEKISLNTLSKFIKSTVKVNWTKHGKVFYITQK